jgi:hypothetical protein
MDAATELAERVVQLLTTQRGQSSYPLTIQHLAQLAVGQTTQDLLARAIKKKNFKERVALVKVGKTTSLVALAEDRVLLAGDPRLLESALRAATPKKAVAQPIAKIASKIPADLRETFAEAVQRQIGEKALPAGIGVLEVDGSPRLYLRDRPPESVVVAELASKLVQTLEAERTRGPEHYPTTLPRLIERAAAQASTGVLKKALAADAFRQRVVLAAPRNAQSLLALKEDLERFVGSQHLLEFVLQCSAKPAIKAFPVKDLKKPLAENLRQPFVDAVNWAIEQDKLPPGVGWLWIKTPHLFFVQDMHAGTAGRTPSPPPLAPEYRGEGRTSVAVPPLSTACAPLSPCTQGERGGGEGAETAKPHVASPPSDGLPDFAGAFTTAFERLDRQAGGRNFVSLVELRRALPVTRGVFDTQLFKLRQAASFCLSAAEGRYGVSSEEREAGIYEEGALLLFVSRNRS